MEITPANTQVQREHSASSESKEMEVSKDLGHTKSLEKSSSFQSEESSKVVEESTTQSMESSHTMQASVSQQMSSEQKVTKATFSSSSSFEASEGNGPINSDQKQETETFIDPNKYSAELDPGPTVLLSEPQSSTSEPYSSTLEPYPSTFTSTLESYSSPPQPFSSTYSSTLDPYSSTPKPFSSAIAEHYSSTIQPPSSTLDAPLNLEPYKPSVEPPTSEPYSSATEPYSSTFSEQVSAVPELEKAKSPPKSSEIEEGKIKDTLKEIISEIDNYVQKDDALKEPKQEVKENAASSENISQLPQMDYSSEALKPELQTHQDVLMARLPSCLISSKSDRPMSLPPETLMKLFNSVQIAHELNQVLKADDTEQKDDENGPSKPINLEKIFTPANDDQILPSKNRSGKMYASSSFYSSNLHPTVEDQVELARRISSSLSDISNQKSKGQSMYVNRKKRSVKWVHEGEGKAPVNGASIEDGGHDENKPMLKLIMDPRGQIQDISSLRKQGYNFESAALSPDVCLQIVHDLNSPKGKGAELFAKRRKKSEKWVVGETNTQPNTQVLDVPTTPYTPVAQPSPQLAKLPPISYLEGSKQRVQHNQKLDEIQEKFSRPRLKLIKSPWEAALETGSVESAFQEMGPVWPGKGNVVAPAVDSYEAALQNDSLPSWNPPPPISNQNGFSYNSADKELPKPFSAPNPVYNSNSVNRIVDSLQKGTSSVDVYKPKLPQSWNPSVRQQSQYSSPYSSLPRPSPQPSVAPSTTSFDNSTSVPQASTYIPTPQASPYIPTPQSNSYVSTPLASPYIPTAQPSPRFLDYNSLNNYNTAPRAWGEVKDYYRPVTFDTSKSANLVYTDF